MERHHITDNIKVLHQASDVNMLFIYEDLTIKFLKPSINSQDENLQRYCKLYCTQPATEVHHDARVLLVPRQTPSTITLNTGVASCNYNTRSNRHI